MGASGSARRMGRWVAVWAIAAISAPTAGAFEFLDGNLEIHGFFEEQIRVLGRDLDAGDGLDLAQWYNVLSVEIDWDIAPDGWGPFDLVSSFARIETRYDCVWTRGCGLFRNADTYGDRAGHLPSRVSDAHRAGLTGSLITGDVRHRHGIPRIPLDPVTGLPDPDGASSLEFHFKDFPLPGNPRRPAGFFNTPVIDDLFNVEGPDEVFGTADDPAPFAFSPVLRDCKYAFRKERGPERGVGTQSMVWNPGCRIRPVGSLRGIPNPFNALDVNPVLSETPGPDGIPGSGDEPTVTVGSTERPFRPAPMIPFTARGSRTTAQGLYYPNSSLRRLLRGDELDSFDQNFSQDELAWNYGASQQNEKNLKELYLDLELLDSRLWIRAGKQNIVWGKTELFRTTDQFNPQDIALATLPDLEESRIALWSVRSVYSLYEVGPFSDVRVEVAFNFDQFEPNDIGRCGEPFAPNPVCNKTFGLLAHGVTGEALAGEARPPNPWKSIRGVEGGARIEWRWSRFSFQLSDFYGYNDLPYIERAFVYERNVDPATGRPRRAGARGPCTTGTEAACLGVAPFAVIGSDGSLTIDPANQADVIDNHHANQQLFALVCSTSIGFSGLDRSVCAQSVLNTPNLASGLAPVAQAVGLMLRGNQNGKVIYNFLATGTTTAMPLRPAWAAALPDPSGSGVDGDLNGDGVVDPLDSPLVALSDEGTVPGDPDSDGGPAMVTSGPFLVFANDPNAGIDAALSDAQEALLGCGPFYGTSCDLHGADLLNAEASALLQAWPGIEGTYEPRQGAWSTRDRSLIQPGTIDLGPDGVRGGGDDIAFAGGTPCGREVAGVLVQLPGCRGPSDPGYDVAVDGRPADVAAALGGVFDSSDILVHPFTRDPFQSEMAALSWNAMMAFVALSGLGEDPADIVSRIDFFNPDDPFGEQYFAATGRHRCSLDRPQFCSNVQAVFLITGLQRNSVRAGGNRRFGRRDFVWHGGTSAVLRYEKRNVLGFSFDVAEDRTKSNWSVELAWIEGLPFEDHDSRDGLTRADTINLTVSMDRPTFINFLNPGRTFFFNTQWFFQYVNGYRESFPTNGPFNVLFTFTAETGYFDDRLQPRMTLVYDVESASGALLPQVGYRYTANLSATVGVNLFMGQQQSNQMELTPLVLENRAGEDAYRDFSENGLSAVRDRDEVFLRVRYTF